MASGSPVKVDGRGGTVARYGSCAGAVVCAVFAALLGSAGAGLTEHQPGQDASQQFQERIHETGKAVSEQFQQRIEEIARNLSDHPRLKKLTQQERENAVEFVVGNVLFVAFHELGHAAIADFRLPVLGREEDAADEFAILRMLWVRTALTRRVLAAATKGWFFNARRGRADGEPLTFYDEHGLDEQRGYQIVCLMVGHDPDRMADLADEMSLPQDRQKGCRKDFMTATSSWAVALEPHLRQPGHPTATIETTYGDAKGDLAVFAQSFRSIQFLETAAARAADSFAWSAPLTLEMRSCGVVAAQWNPETRTLTLCYELAADFAELYRDFGQATANQQPGRSLKPAMRPSSQNHVRRYLAANRRHASSASRRAYKRSGASGACDRRRCPHRRPLPCDARCGHASSPSRSPPRPPSRSSPRRRRMLPERPSSHPPHHPRPGSHLRIPRRPCCVAATQRRRRRLLTVGPDATGGTPLAGRIRAPAVTSGAVAVIAGRACRRPA